MASLAQIVTSMTDYSWPRSIKIGVIGSEEALFSPTKVDTPFPRPMAEFGVDEGNAIQIADSRESRSFAVLYMFRM